mgnify:CR=1 FL=1
MLFKKYFSPVYFYHLILFLSFSISLNNLVVFEYVNLFFYVLAHLTIIYLCFYYFHFILYFVFFLYGIFFDIFLLNDIGPHLLVFIFLLVIISSLKKFLFNLSPIKIFYVIIVLMFLIFLFEMIFADIILEYNFDYFKYFRLSIIGTIIISPVIFLFSKIDRL